MFRPETIDELNAIVLPVLQRLIDERGEDGSGARNFYVQRLRKGSILGDYDIALVKAFLERGLGKGGVHEIGAGFGQLPLLFALNGIDAVGIEFDRSRAVGATMMHAALSSAHPIAGARVRMIHGAFPLSRADLPPTDAVLLSTNLVATTKPEAKAAICKAMTHYAMTVVDIDRLFEKQTDDDGRRTSVNLMSAAGFQPPEPFLDLGNSGRYFAFARPVTPKPTALAALLQGVTAPSASRAQSKPTDGAKSGAKLASQPLATSSLAQARQRLAKRARARGITRVVYFHTDHFEPWQAFDGRRALGPENARDLERFAAEMAAHEYGRKLTLFIKPHLNFTLRRGANVLRATQEDDLGFIERPPEEIETARAALAPIIDRTGIEFQLHVHHENYTSNAVNTAAGTEVGNYLATPKGAALDAARFEFAVRQNLDILQQEVGRSFTRWFFIHGHWALNASDDKDCRIVDEIGILQQLGCLGDFTCPAGRPNVDPRHESPYLALPVSAPKGYDTRAADPVPLAGAGQTVANGRFLVWASAAKHAATSIDHSAEFVRRRGKDLEAAAARLIDQCYLHNGTLYVKTHSHSMHPAYSDGRAPACFPHAYPVTRDLLGLTFDAAADGGAEIAFLTTSEVYDELVNSPVKSTVDLKAAFADQAAGGVLQRALAWSKGKVWS